MAKKNIRAAEGITQKVRTIKWNETKELLNEGVISKLERKFSVKKKDAEVGHKVV